MTAQAEYTLNEKLHEGAGIIIHRAVRSRDGARVILKISKGGPGAPAVQGALRHEFAVLRALDLPGVIKAHALTSVGGELALVLEDFGGRSLDVLFERGALDLATVLKVGVEVAGTLDLLHRFPLLHRDIKPHNVVLEPTSGQVKLIDFSVAVAGGDEAQAGGAGEGAAGTLAYMSPEQTGRMNRPIDARSDLYSLGVTLYELLTGSLPFEAEDALALVHSQLARVPVPPATRMPRVPQVVSDIVMKLLAKAAEDRYQSAAGLRADLQRCVAGLAAGASIEPFPLGAADRPSTPSIPPKLYGRREEVDALLSAFTRAADGGAVLLLVRGQAGVGKSALVHSLAAPVARGGGFFVAAKCDQYDRGVPYGPITHVLRELCRTLLTSPPDALESWRRDLQAALGSSGKLLTDLIPDLELVVGPQPEVPRLGPAEAQNRFNLVFTALLRAFAGADHPLVLFFDDLQWADPASLRLLQEMLFDAESGYLLVAGAYREDELGAGHPLRSALAELQAAGTEIRELELAPLALADVEELLADTLVMERAQVAALARIVGDKTHRNPFFIGQFLLLLAEDGLLRWDAAACRWVWDDAQIQARDVTDNVVALVAGKIQRLSPRAQRLLQMAACVGYRFSWRVLEAVDPERSADAGPALEELLREGLVLPVGAGGDGDDLHRFLHDRVQQAADSLLAEEERLAAHLRIGRLLRDAHPDGVPDDALFEVVGHLDLVIPYLEDDERLALARLDLRAGRRARAATAYHAARQYFQCGRECLGADPWSRFYELAFPLRVELAECTHLCGAFAEADALFEDALARARTRAERAQVYDLRILLYAAMGDFDAVLASGRAALAMYDVYLPDEGPALQEAIGAAFAASRANLGERSVASLLDAPPASDPDIAMVMRLLASMSGPCFVGKPALFPLIVLHMVNLSLRHGHVDGSDYTYSVYGLLLAGVAGALGEGHEFGELGVKLNERTGDLNTRCMVHFLWGTSLVFYREPYAAGQAYRESARRVALEVGNFAYVSFYCLQSAALALLADDDLRAAAARFDDLVALLRKTRDAASTTVVEFMRRVLLNLTGEAPASSLGGDGFDEAAFVAHIPQGGLVPWLYAVSKLRLTYLYGEHVEGLALAARARELQATGAGSGHNYRTEHSFYAGLTAAARHDHAGDDEKPGLAQLLEAERAALRVWSTSNPTQFLPMQLLLDAEAARLAGREYAAIGGYEQAIAEARARGFVLHAALASECAGRLHLRRGRRSLACAYLQDAQLGFLRWGAQAKAQQMAAVHVELLSPPAPARPAHASGRATTTTRVVGGGSLDVEGLLRAAQAVAGELQLDRLLDRWMRIVMLRAGAQRGFLLVPEGDRWLIAAEMRTAPDEIRIGMDRPLEDDAALATSVVRLVARSREGVVLGDIAAEPRFARDPHVAAHKPQSVLCLPLLHQGRLSGILYVENNAARDAFAGDRVELLQLLSAQAAVAIENARLYASVQQARQELARANEVLEQEVEARTHDLQTAMTQLQAVNDDLVRRGDALREAHARTQREVQERERAERERAAAQAETLRVQEERLADMAAPLIPITDTVVVMPLIGVIDRARAAQVLEAALAGTVRTRAQVVILDVTGVRQLDAAAATTLVQAASALRLVGAQAVLTGVNPATAQLLVRDDAPLGGLLTLGTLQSGIAYALGHTRGAAR